MTRPNVPHLARITIYPVKSLNGRDVPEASVLPSGALEHDRRLALVDAQGSFVNGKRSGQVHRIRSAFDPRSRMLTLGLQGRDDRHDFHLDTDRDALHNWLAAFFGFPVVVAEEAGAGFPDDTAAPGPTVLSTATMVEVARWFPGLAVDEARRRFRANLEIGGVEPFWEDRLYAEPDQVVRFRIGAVVLEGTNPCQRCVVPTRSPLTGEPIPGFAKAFTVRRREGLPAWAPASRFDHSYRLAVNTRLSDPAGGMLRVGDEVEILGPAPR